MAELEQYCAPLVKKMQEEAVGDGKRWFPDTAKSVFFNIASMMGEAGEAFNAAKKIERGDTSWLDPEQREAVLEEIADCFTYMLEAVGLLGGNLITEYYKKRAFNERRFGGKS